MTDLDTAPLSPTQVRRLLNWTIQASDVRTCDCGSYQWFLTNDGQCVCSGCRHVSTVIRVVRAEIGNDQFDSVST